MINQPPGARIVEALPDSGCKCFLAHNEFRQRLADEC